MDLSAVLVAMAMVLAVMSGWVSEAAAADVTEKGTSVGCICSGVKWEERTFALNKPSVFEGACRDEDFVADAGAKGADECKDGAVWNEPTCGQVADYFAGHHGAETCEDLRRSFQTVEAYDDVLTNCCVTKEEEAAQYSTAPPAVPREQCPNSLQTYPWLCDEHKAAANGLTFVIEYFDSNDCSGTAKRISRGVLGGDAAALDYDQCTQGTSNVWLGSNAEGTQDSLPMTRSGAPPADWITPVSLLKDDEGNYVDAPENATKGAFPTLDQIKARFAGQDFFYTGNTFWESSKPFEEENKVNQYAYILKPGWDAQVFANEASVQGIRLHDRLNNAERTPVPKEFKYYVVPATATVLQCSGSSVSLLPAMSCAADDLVTSREPAVFQRQSEWPSTANRLIGKERAPPRLQFARMASQDASKCSATKSTIFDNSKSRRIYFPAGWPSCPDVVSDKLRLPTGTILEQAEEGVATNTFSEKTHEFVLPPHMPAAIYTLRLIKHEGNPIMHIGTSRHFLHSKSDDGADVTASEGTVSHKFEGRTPAALYARVECLEGTACSYTVKGDITSCIEGKYAADHPTCDSVTLRALIDVQCADGFFAYKKECLKELPGCGFGGPCLPTQIPKEEA